MQAFCKYQWCSGFEPVNTCTHSYGSGFQRFIHVDEIKRDLNNRLHKICSLELQTIIDLGFKCSQIAPIKTGSFASKTNLKSNFIESAAVQLASPVINLRPVYDCLTCTTKYYELTAHCQQLQSTRPDSYWVRRNRCLMECFRPGPKKKTCNTVICTIKGFPYYRKFIRNTDFGTWW